MGEMVEFDFDSLPSTFHEKYNILMTLRNDHKLQRTAEGTNSNIFTQWR